jgi:hypothetical protein
MEPHESGALWPCTAAQRREAEKAAHGDYPSTTLTGAVFWIASMPVDVSEGVFSTGFDRFSTCVFECRFWLALPFFVGLRQAHRRKIVLRAAKS